MKVAQAVWKNGQIVLEGPVDWPEGARLVIEPISAQDNRIGATEEDWSNQPEDIAEWLRWLDSLEPLIFTPEEEADIAAWRQKIKEYTIANMHKNVEGLFE